MSKCDCWKPEHGPLIHQKGCDLYDYRYNNDLDALAEKIYANNPKWSLDLGGRMFREMGLITPEYAYNLAQEFLDYKKSRGEK